MTWKDILKEDAPQFNNLKEMVDWMGNNNIKNGKGLVKEFYKLVMQKVQYADAEMQSKVTAHAQKVLEPLTNYVTKDMGLRDQWSNLLQQGKIM
tara:strand:+ start:56 stop:337 length:282 start_codon:yes stop_codon:yes gene_type:complete